MRILPALLLLFAPSLAAQNYEVIASESFAYPTGPLGQMAGGSGFEVPWYSGGGDNDALVTAPGFDANGNKATTNYEHGGSYRLIDRSLLGPILDQGQLGKDNTTIWIEVTMQREPGSDDLYGGLSLVWQFVGEMLFLGSPWGTDEMGFERPGTSQTFQIPGSSVDNLNTLVYRIDFLPGSERVQMWLNPGISYPTTPPDLDQSVDDFRFNELRIQSGSGAVTGLSVDDLELSTPTFGPVYSVTNAVAGAVATFQVGGCTPGTPVLIGWSTAGPGPTSTPYGDVDMTMPIGRLPKLTADASGNAGLNATVPPALQGLTVWTQVLNLTGPGTGLLSNSLVVVIL